MGRQEKPLADLHSPQGALAAFLRALRTMAELTYTDMGAGVPSAVSTLSQAASGDTVPTLKTVRDYVTACRLDGSALTTALTRAETLWRNAVLHAKGITHPAGTTGLPDDQARTPGQFAEAVTALLGNRGLFALRDIEEATAKAGQRIPRSTLARLLNRNAKTVMSSAVLNVLLDACEIHNAMRREAWITARTHAALATAGLTTHSVTADGHVLAHGDLHSANVTLVDYDRLDGTALGDSIANAGMYFHSISEGDVIISPDGTATPLGVGAVTEDLERLCRGHGVYATPPTFGPVLLSVLNRLTLEGVGRISRMGLITLLENASTRLPAELRRTFRIAANLGDVDGLPGGTTSSLRRRLETLAEAQQVDVRTVRRHLRHAAELLAEQLLSDYLRTTRPDS